MTAWACWRHAREQWCEDHGGFWPTGEVEMWAEAWAVRPGPTTRPVLPPRDEAGRRHPPPPPPGGRGPGGASAPGPPGRPAPGGGARGGGVGGGGGPGG